MIITPWLVLFMLLVFILVFLFINTIDKRKWLTFLISLVITPLVYFYVFYPFINIISSYHHQKYFNAQDWREKPALRYEMADHTVESDTLIGKSKAEISALLGTYEWLSWNEAQKAHDDNKWNYGLGIEPGAFNSDKDCLEVSFKDNTVVALRTYQEEITYDNEEQ
ncbi:MAG: hypothetical protein HKM26_00445 [Winogradskyella sp.]|nr:hypothetical protein [Winogradskyella sp.]